MENRKSIKLGYYQVLRRLARGGMSEVYVVLDERDAQLYALKMLRQQNEEDCQRFQQEIQVLMRIKHPNILPILHADSQDDDICYYVMPYVEQGTLKDRLVNGPLTPQEAKIVLTQVAGALEFLHQAGFVHRDVKPSNILQGENEHVWLADFGLVRAIEGGSDLTRTGYLLGTPTYMAPELEKKPASAASDVYSLGVVLYEMVTGQVPFTGETLLDVYLKQIYGRPPLPSTLNPLLTPTIDQVIMRALEKEPSRRYASAAALAQAYQEALQLGPVTPVTDTHLSLGKTDAFALSPSIVVRSQRQGRSRKLSLVIGALLVMAMLTLGLASASIASHNGVSLFSLSPVHASSSPSHQATPVRGSTPLSKPPSPGPSSAGTPALPGGAPHPGITPTAAGNQPGSGATSPPSTSANTPGSTPSPGNSAPNPPSPPPPPPVNTPPVAGTPVPPVSTAGGAGNQNGNGNGKGKGKGKDKGKGDSQGNGNGNS